MSQELLDPTSTALIVIDLQQGIVGRPLAPHSGDEVVNHSVRVANALRNAGGTVVFVHVLLHEFQARKADAPLRAPDAPLPPPSASELVPGLGVQPDDLVIAKRSWGAFYNTDLDQQLKSRGIKTVLMAGIATNFGVESTGRAAYDHGYDVVFIHDAMSSFNVEAHNFAVQNIFARCGRVRSFDETLQMLTTDR